jgi:hypothetical protein
MPLRALSLLAGILLATALVALAPAADARADACTSLTSGTACPGIVCYDSNADRHLTSDECVDRCLHQTDCCATTSFWCPDRE